jgi:hypothetical protein
MNYTPSLPEGTQIKVKGLLENLDQRFKYLYPLVSPDVYYYHHGVYLGNFNYGNCQVIHFFGENKADATPRMCHIEEFRSRGENNGAIYRVGYTNTAADLTVAQTKALAREVLAHPEKWPKYDIKDNNCETFATYLTKGRGFSDQASNAMSYGINTWGIPIMGIAIAIAAICYKYFKQ